MHAISRLGYRARLNNRVTLTLTSSDRDGTFVVEKECVMHAIPVKGHRCPARGGGGGVLNDMQSLII